MSLQRIDGNLIRECNQDCFKRLSKVPNELGDMDEFQLSLFFTAWRKNPQDSPYDFSQFICPIIEGGKQLICLRLLRGRGRGKER